MIHYDSCVVPHCQQTADDAIGAANVAAYTPRRFLNHLRKSCAKKAAQTGTSGA